MKIGANRGFAARVAQLLRLSRDPTASFPEPPLPNSYWVIPGSLLAGEYPGAHIEAQARERIARLCAAGIDSFVDLTEEFEAPDYRGSLPEHCAYFRCPIVDCAVPADPAQMQDLLQYVRRELAAGRRIYIHCRAGIGRTGLAVGCLLVDQGLGGAAALKRLNLLWRQSARSKTWREVPQTYQQTAYIRGWQRRRE
jgi:protein-tyrosine phosphatase